MKERIMKFFKFEERRATFKGEFIGGLVTFLAMSYILAVNPSMISAAGIPRGGAFIATALGASIATIVMSLVANYPVALAPGMGVNAFFTFTIVGGIAGTSSFGLGYSWQEALAISFLGGVLFVIISFTPLRKKLIEAIPSGLKAAIGVGIGFFIAFVGLQNAGIVTQSSSTGVTLGNFSNPNVLVAIFGIILIFVLHNLNSKVSRFSFILAILGTAVLYAVLSLIGVEGLTKIELFKYSELAGFKDSFGGFITGFKTLFQDSPAVLVDGVVAREAMTASAKLITLPFIVFALLFVDIFDTAGTLVAVTKAAKLEDENGELPNLDKALFSDAIGTLISSAMGTPEITSYVESSTGVESGARTGFSNLVVAFLFLISIALYPVMSVFGIFPVTSMALVLVGVLMAAQIKEINWDDKAIAIASFMTILGMVVTYSVSDGIAFGFISYSVSMLAQKRAKEVHPLIFILSVGFVIYFGVYSKLFM
ncbi:NCS2 family permease [Haploplasma axanthum]|uniref:Guanine/hypoxanthine permease pbuG n=1 Tax=Haploplasma axanthum TaxID=29552 RepID=A0A449BDL9_HAPAX|nr:NCS2 family permease [Haploplasma axanthum]VEU80517.1 Guanine/hypoxanthine permease pbuG [Haploplasma axanthum]